MNFSLPSIVAANSLTLATGHRFYMNVSCTNNVGLASSIFSDIGVLVDITPPKKGTVIVSPDRTHDVYGIHSSCHLYNSTMRAHWSGFSDSESGIAGFKVGVGRNPDSSNVLPLSDIGRKTTFSCNIGANEGVSSGDIVYILVEARNAAGLTTRAVSSPTRLVAADSDVYSKEGDFFCLDV